MDDFIESKIGDLTVRINRDQCIGSGNCIKLCPQALDIDEEDVVCVKPAPSEFAAAQLVEACSVCPVDALCVIDATGKPIVS